MEGHAKRIEFSSAIKKNFHISQSYGEGEVLEEQKNVGQASSLRTRVAQENDLGCCKRGSLLLPVLFRWGLSNHSSEGRD